MNTKEYSFNASVLYGKKIIKGILHLSIYGYEFIESYRVSEKKEIDWRMVEYTTGVIDVPVLKFFSSKRKYIELKNNNGLSSKYIIEDKEISNIIKLIKDFRKDLEADERDKELKYQEQLRREEEERQRQIEDARRQEELARQEAERVRQEELVRQKELARQEELAYQNVDNNKRLKIKENEFLEWCSENNFKISTAKGYVSAIRSAEKFLKENNICSMEIMEITSADKVEFLVEEMTNHPKFMKSSCAHYVHGMKAYVRYLQDIQKESDSDKDKGRLDISQNKNQEVLSNNEVERRYLIEKFLGCLSSYANLIRHQEELARQEAERTRREEFERRRAEKKQRAIIELQESAKKQKEENTRKRIEYIQKEIERREDQVQSVIQKAISEKKIRENNEKKWKDHIVQLEELVDDQEDQAHEQEYLARQVKSKRQEIQRRYREILMNSVETEEDKRFRILQKQSNDLEHLILVRKENKRHRDHFFFVKENQFNIHLQEMQTERDTMELVFTKEIESEKGIADKWKSVLEQKPDDMLSFNNLRTCLEKMENIAQEYYCSEHQLQNELRNMYEEKSSYLVGEKEHFEKLLDLESSRLDHENLFLKELETFIQEEINRKEEERKRQEDERKRREELARQMAEKRRQEEEKRKIVDFACFEAAKKAKEDKIYREKLALEEAERVRQEELARQETERVRQEELARQEAERVRQEELARQEAERVRQEELARQEAERVRQEELARQETERVRQEELARQEAERVRQEELARQEAERVRQEELAQQETERKIKEAFSHKKSENQCNDNCVCQEAKETFSQKEETSIFSSLIYRMSTKTEYSYGYQIIGDQVIEFFNNMYLEDDFASYIDENMSDYDVLRAEMEYIGISKHLCNEFENIISELYYEENLDDSIIAFVERLCMEASGNMEYVSSTGVERYRIKTYDSEDTITGELHDVRREQREEKRRTYERNYNRVLEYIKAQKIPVEKTKILKSLPGINHNILRDVVVHESKVLNYYRTYIWYDNLNITSQDENIVSGYVESIVDDYDTHHITELYEELNFRYSDFLRRNMINTPHRLFSVVQVMCKDIISSERPYIASKGVKILNAKERIERYIRNRKDVSVKELLEYASSNYMQVGNTLQMLNELNSTHIFKDKLTLISVRDYRLSYTIARKIENVFFEEVEDNGAMAICELTGSKKLPDISLEWNEWLIYSLLLKWGSRLGVTTSGNNFREAIPVIYIGTAPDEEQLENIGNRAKGKTLGSSVDISDVDSVLDDVLDDILDDLEF